MTVRVPVARLRAVLLAAVLGTAAGARAVRADEAGAPPDLARAAAHELARRVANPAASLISVPIQFNFDDGIGPYDGGRWTANLQPVVPISLGPASPVRLISRTVLPFVQADGGASIGDVSGVGDLTQSVFVANRLPRSGWTLGLGPVIQAPTGSDARLTTDRWSLGPTAIAVHQSRTWTWGALVNHVWSVAGESAGPDVSTTFVQPFVNYLAPTHTTLALNTEASRDWEAKTWSVPVNLIVNQIVKVGPRPMSVFVGARWWADGPDAGPEGIGWRFGTTLLFPARRPAHPAETP